MPKSTRYARIAITLPEQDLAAADRLARARDRSRSWIIAAAIRQFVAAAPPTPVRSGLPPADESGASDAELPSQAGLGTSRLAQLKRDLALTPEARVREAEETLRLTEQLDRPGAHRVIAFDRYEDYLDWKRGRDRSR